MILTEKLEEKVYVNQEKSLCAAHKNEGFGVTQTFEFFLHELLIRFTDLHERPKFVFEV